MPNHTTSVETFMEKHGITSDSLDDMHNAKGMTYSQIANVFNCSVGSICNLFFALNLSHRHSGWIKGQRHHTEEAKKKIGDKNRGKKATPETKKKQSLIRKEWYAKGNHSNLWKGGRKVRRDGYIQIFTPSHPHSTKDGYVLEHRLVMEKIIGRYLSDEEIVHHINGVRDDNRPENLFLFASNADHQRYHALYTRKRNKRGFVS